MLTWMDRLIRMSPAPAVGSGRRDAPAARSSVLPRDKRFLTGIGGGRMHYCGITGEIIDDFFRVPSITGLDVDWTRHDFYALCDRARNRSS
jgi:hypothetical protein